MFGKASRSRVEDILAIFRQRFLTEVSVTQGIGRAGAGSGFPPPRSTASCTTSQPEPTGCCTMSSSKSLLPLQARGITDIDVVELKRPLKKWVDEGKTSGQWSDPTIVRIAQGLLSALRDFGVLQGAVKKRIAPAYLPVEAFAFLMFYLKQHQPSGAKLARTARLEAVLSAPRRRRAVPVRGPPA